MTICPCGKQIRKTEDTLCGQCRKGKTRKWKQINHHYSDREAKQPFEMVKKCLKCERPFPSTGKGNRMCQQCRNYSGNVYG